MTKEQQVMKNRLCSRICLALMIIGITLGLLQLPYTLILFSCGIFYCIFAIYFEQEANRLKGNPVSEATKRMLSKALEGEDSREQIKR